jgi:tetratricopeptide (TPR) repeat protein
MTLRALVASALLLVTAGTPVALAQRTGGAAHPPHLSAAAAVASAGAIDATAWHRVTTPHFVLLGDLPQPALRALASDLEALESLLAGLNPADLPPPPPAKLLIFATDAAFADHAPHAADGTPAPVSGFFMGHPHGDFIVASGAQPQELRSVLYHEALHRYLRHHLPQAPLWLNEGLAEFYSTLEVGRGEALVGRPVAAHLARLRRESRRPLDALLRAGADSHPMAHDRRPAAFYAESWALVHSLLGADGGRAAVARYAGLLRAGHDAVEAFAEAFGDTGSIERRVDAHLLAPVHRPLRTHLPAVAPAQSAAAATRADVHHELGWLLARHAPPRLDAARRHLEAALRADADHAGAVAGLGFLDELAGDDDGARLHYARAAALAPRDALAQFLRAQSIARSAAALPEEERGTQAEQALLEDARDGFRRALTLEPGFAEAWAALGAAWVADRAPAGEGLEALREAYRRLPTRDDVLHNLTVLEGRLGSRSRADELYAELERRASPDRVEHAREALLRVDLERAERMLGDGHTSAAIELMSRVLAETRDRDLASAVAARLEQLERALAGGAGR